MQLMAGMMERHPSLMVKCMGFRQTMFYCSTLPHLIRFFPFQKPHPTCQSENTCSRIIPLHRVYLIRSDNVTLVCFPFFPLALLYLTYKVTLGMEIFFNDILAD